MNVKRKGSSSLKGKRTSSKIEIAAELETDESDKLEPLDSVFLDPPKRTSSYSRLTE